MSIRLMAQVWENGPEKQGELLVLLALADYADDRCRCFPSMAAVAQRARMDERSARRIIARLEAAGWLTREINRGRGAVNVYTIKPDPETRIKSPPKEQNRTETTLKPDRNDTKTGPTCPPEPSVTIKEPSVRKNARAREVLCEVMAEELAEDFIAHRKAVRAPLTDKAAKMIAKKVAEGTVTARDIERSIENGWKGVFPSNETKGRDNGRTGADIAAEAAAIYRARLDSGTDCYPSQPLLPTGDAAGREPAGPGGLDWDDGGQFDGGNQSRLRIVSS